MLRGKWSRLGARGERRILTLPGIEVLTMAYLISLVFYKVEVRHLFPCIDQRRLIWKMLAPHSGIICK